MPGHKRNNCDNCLSFIYHRVTLLGLVVYPTEMQHYSRHRGFTLMEMTIVIVIIGLLMGGMVTARGFLKNSQYTTMMNETKYYINAFGQFQGKYQSVPGDMPNADTIWTGAANGDGNGFLRTTATCDSVTNAAACKPLEIFGAFQHLAKAGLITGNFTGTSAGAGTLARGNVNVPGSSVQDVTYIFDHPDSLRGNVTGGTDPLYFNGIYFHVLRVASMSALGTALQPELPKGVFLTPKEAFQIDSKYDDGIPDTGSVLTPNATALPNCTAGAAPATYNVANRTAACNLILRFQ